MTVTSYKVNGIRVYAPSNSEQLIHFAMAKQTILIALNAEKVIASDSTIKDLINTQTAYPDGYGVVLALKKKGATEVRKIAGCELWLDIAARYEKEKSFYLIGATETVIERVVHRLLSDFPGMNILGHRSGYIKSDEERRAIISEIELKKPDVVFVAMGSPLQEELMSEMWTVHKALYQGLGGSFDVYAGFAARAPKWWIDKKLEWLYRLLKNPRRLNRQLHYLSFLWRLFTHRL